MTSGTISAFRLMPIISAVLARESRDSASDIEGCVTAVTRLQHRLANGLPYNLKSRVSSNSDAYLSMSISLIAAEWDNSGFLAVDWGPLLVRLYAEAPTLFSQGKRTHSSDAWAAGFGRVVSAIACSDSYTCRTDACIAAASAIKESIRECVPSDTQDSDIPPDVVDAAVDMFCATWVSISRKETSYLSTLSVDDRSTYLTTGNGRFVVDRVVRQFRVDFHSIVSQFVSMGGTPT